MDIELPVGDEPDYKYGCLACFELEKKIGKGQFSEVVRARCNSDNSVVALKKVQVLSLFYYPYA